MGEAYRPPMGVSSVWSDPCLTDEMTTQVMATVAGRLPVEERMPDPGRPDAPLWAMVELELQAILGALDAMRARPDRRDGRACIAYRLGAEHALMRTYPGLPGPFGPAYAAGWLDAHDHTDRVLWWARSAAEEDMAKVVVRG